MKPIWRLASALFLPTAVAFAGSVSVSSPSSGSTVGSPAHFVASATSGAPITGMKIYVDGSSKYSTGSNKIDTYLSLASGSRFVVIKAWDSTGASFSSTRTINVSGTSSSSGGLTVSSPSNGATVSSPFHVVASQSGAKTIKVYVDSQEKYSADSSSIDASLSTSTGSRYVVVQSWDQYGNVKKVAMTVNVASSSSSSGDTTTTTGGKTTWNIDQMTGWQSCSDCAGIGGDGPVAPYGMKQFVGDPSMDGKSAEFWLGGDVPYSNALWWKQLGGQSAAKKFVYDLYFYIKDPEAAQSLEFDMNQSVDGRKYIFGTQCAIVRGKWEVWDTANVKWMDTGIPCYKPEAYKWHHLLLEFERTNDRKTRFVSVTLNGKKSYINKYYYSRSGGYSELNVAFQMDGNYQQKDYKVWLDKVHMTWW